MRHIQDDTDRVVAARGFTLIELLIVVAIIGIIAAISVPGLLNAANRGKQSGTMGDMRTMISAIEHYSVDNNAYPVAGNLDELAEALEGGYIKRLPRKDSWGHRFQYAASRDGMSYTLSSFGKDGQAQGSAPQGGMHSFAADIVASDGAFLQWPAGKQD